jgi:hypothetical protein
VSITSTYVVLCENDKCGVLPIAKNLRRSVESCGVSLYSFEGLDLDKATRPVEVLGQEVGGVSLVAEIKAQRLMPQTRDRRTERGSVDEVTFER